MAICGIVITLDDGAPGGAGALQALARARGIALTLAAGSGPRLPAVLETPGDDDGMPATVGQLFDALRALPGVLHVDLAYAHYDAETR